MPRKLAATDEGILRHVRHSDSRLLRGFSADELSVIVKAAVSRRYAANSVIANQADRADYLFLLTEGNARFFFITENGRKLFLRWLSSGDIIGAATFLPEPQPYHLSTEVVVKSRLLVWSRSTLHGLCARYPRLVQNAMCIAADYLDWYLTAHSALVSETVRQRCGQVLLRIAQVMGHKVPRGVEIQITNEELANTAAISPFEASRLMSAWQRSGALTKKRGKIILRSRDLS